MTRTGRTGRIPVQVEPLDDERFTNIERRLVIGVSEMSAKPVRAWSRSLAFAGAAMAVVAAGVIGWKLRGSGPTAPVIEPEDQHVAIKTDTEHSTLALDDATIASDPATAFDVTRGHGRVLVLMTRGKLDLAVQHRAGRVFVIRAGDTEIEDVGTRFSVDYDGKDHVDVRVTEGEVKVTRHQQAVRVAAGNAWTTETGLIALAELERRSTPPIATTTTTTVATVEPSAELHDHHAVAPESPATPRKLATTTTSHATPASVPVEIQPHARPEPVDPYVDLRLAIRKVPLEFDPRIDGHADAGAEIGKLKKIAYSATLGRDASQALYQIAVLLHRPLGQDTEALHTLDWYFRRFKAGKEMHAALWLRVRILCTRAIDDECRKAAYSYQHEVETGAAADVAIRITNAQ